MAERLESDIEEHLLSRTEPVSSLSKPVSTACLVVKRFLEMALVLIFAAWVTLVFIYPAGPVNEFIVNGLVVTSNDIYGITGSAFLLFSGPILVITLLAIACIHVSGDTEEKLLLKRKPAKYPRLRLWTFPVLVDGPFGVVSAAEFIGICLVTVYVLWGFIAYTFEDISIASEFGLSPSEESLFLLELSALRIGVIGLFCLAFLFLPVARGSALLRLVDIPFEQATRYHVWLGHLTMMLFTLHGLFFVISWAIAGTLIDEITSWADTGVANLPGVIGLLAGLLMWVTSLPLVRKKQFEVFYYTHQLYIVFVIFLALHVGDYTFCIASGGIFLFMMDRFLRFCQSRKTVNVISATRFPCGIVELVLSKPANLQYNALSFIFLQIRGLSLLQWHPFSVSSSPLDGKNSLSVLIKVLGEWTAKLDSSITDILDPRDQNGTSLKPQKITASVEGPYGHELPYHLTYENLVLIAGGIGISPFLAILGDILHRVGAGKPCLPSKVQLVWATRRSNELPLLSSLDAAESIRPDSPNKLNLVINIYVTQELEPSLEEGNIENTGNSCVFPVQNGHGMSVLVGTGNVAWLGLYVMSSIFGFIVSMTLLNIFYLNPFKVMSSWYRGILFVACMLVTVIVFGGVVVYLWSCWDHGTYAIGKFKYQQQNLQPSNPTQSDSPQRTSVCSRKVIYGSRPNIEEIFGSVSDQWGNADIGVIVCGPSTLVTSVARECRSRNLKRGSDLPVFHFHSHTFSL